MEFREELLITLVQERPAIWDYRLQSHSDKYVVERMLKEVADNFKDKDAAFCKAKWQHIRDARRNNINRNKSRSGSEGKVGRPYKYAQQLSFLDGLDAAVDNTSSNLDVQPRHQASSATVTARATTTASVAATTTVAASTTAPARSTTAAAPVLIDCSAYLHQLNELEGEERVQFEQSHRAQQQQQQNEQQSQAESGDSLDFCSQRAVIASEVLVEEVGESTFENIEGDAVEMNLDQLSTLPNIRTNRSPSAPPSLGRPGTPDDPQPTPSPLALSDQPFHHSSPVISASTASTRARVVSGFRRAGRSSRSRPYPSVGRPAGVQPLQTFQVPQTSQLRQQLEQEEQQDRRRQEAEDQRRRQQQDPPRRQTRVMVETDTERAILEELRSSNNNDDCSMFCASLAPQLRLIPPERRNFVKIQLLTVLQDALYSDS